MTRSRHIALVAIAWGVVLTTPAIFFGAEDLRYVLGGRSLEATVEDLNCVSTRPAKGFASASCDVGYEFALPGTLEMRKGRGEVGPWLSEELKVGGRLWVQVMIAEPSLNRPRDTYRTACLVALLGLGAGLLYFGAKRYFVPRSR